MAFLDNSGDIILDAVITDLGRKLLASADGSFEISQFAVCDDEIDYSLYDKAHASGSSYYDLEILQLPVMEAFTNNMSSCKNKLVSFANMELLFLPVLKINEQNSNSARHSTYKTFLIAADEYTEDDAGNSGTTKGVVPSSSDGADQRGFIRGETLKGEGHIRVDFGLDTEEISPRQGLGELAETEFIVQMDSRFGTLTTPLGTALTPDTIDDDFIASYTISMSDVANQIVTNNDDVSNSTQQVIKGPRGATIQFKIRTSMDLQTSTFLFTRLGGVMTGVPNRGGGTTDLYYIDSIIRIQGTRMGSSVDVPVRYVKFKS